MTSFDKMQAAVMDRRKVKDAPLTEDEAREVWHDYGYCYDHGGVLGASENCDECREYNRDQNQALRENIAEEKRSFNK